MARIAFAWELGGEYGHVMSCAGLAGGLEMRGHKIAFMFRELRQLRVLPEARGYDIFQAPRILREGEGMTAHPVSYAEIMFGCGYRNPNDLIGLVGGWHSLLKRWKPDLVVVDFAPTSLIACRILGLPAVTFGNGFFYPPMASPLPPFRIDEPIDPAHLARLDAQALANVNTAIRRFGGKPLDRLCDLFETQESFLCTMPELDHYGTRETTGYWGPRVRFDRGADVAWPHADGKRIFVYVKKELAQLDTLVGLIEASPHRVVAYIPELDEARRKRLSGRHHIYSDRPIRLENFLRNCDLMVSHGGEIAAGALLYGVPQLLFPTHYEQYLTARRLHQLHCGFWCAPHAPAADVQRGFNEVLTDPRYLSNARAFAARYPAFSPAEQRRRIIARIEALLARSGAMLPPPSTSQGQTQ